MIDVITEPWHWALGGFAISLVMFLLIFSGQKFGVSTSLTDTCSMIGLGQKFEHFRYDWKAKSWLFMFVIGTVIGAWIASNFLLDGNPISIADKTTETLQGLGISSPHVGQTNSGFLPDEIFASYNLSSIAVVLSLLIAGMFIGFGTRYAGGCTSGHAITGLSNFQLPSLVAVIGFFIGGLCMTHFIMPTILSWIL